MLVTETFKALGDPIRLTMIERLADGTTYTLGGISDGLGLTRQGARKHLQVLADVELVSMHIRGRQTQVTLDTTALSAAKAFIADLEVRWDHRLEALRKFVENDTPKTG
jgi:DNA-binding transcriptional ArsR family regulator